MPMPKPAVDDDTIEAIVVATLHEDLVAWLQREHPEANPLAVLGALSYEIGRVVGELADGLGEDQIAAMLDGVRETMALHVRAFQRGMRT
jgi:hypothetical protein